VRGKEYKKVEVQKGKPKCSKIMTEFVVKRTMRRSELREKTGARDI